jgi:hypothetical protein
MATSSSQPREPLAEDRHAEGDGKEVADDLAHGVTPSCSDPASTLGVPVVSSITGIGGLFGDARVTSVRDAVDSLRR